MHIGEKNEPLTRLSPTVKRCNGPDKLTCGLIALLDLLGVTLHQEIIEVWIAEESLPFHRGYLKVSPFCSSPPVGFLNVSGVPDVVIVVDSLVLLAEHVVHHGLVVLISQHSVVLIHSASRLFPGLHVSHFQIYNCYNVMLAVEKLASVDGP